MRWDQLGRVHEFALSPTISCTILKRYPNQSIQNCCVQVLFAQPQIIPLASPLRQRNRNSSCQGSNCRSSSLWLEVETAPNLLFVCVLQDLVGRIEEGPLVITDGMERVKQTSTAARYSPVCRNNTGDHHKTKQWSPCRLSCLLSGIANPFDSWTWFWISRLLRSKIIPASRRTLWMVRQS